ncbi:hypothetical protein KFL_001490020 [Klebsormidium nitens]|uniref:Uncharacterized protein n=1 Tax=Klebsormidium nitens TaxID=105231 RepID=A0A1Y1I2Q2_KLENI|nr:hypothetical protein KFL_001490020 [Klebsormidium nitens]|eukprot:GAQ83461.1 hypothetical protein KFL_001490020 [Klebsormidium nitens]
MEAEQKGSMLPGAPLPSRASPSAGSSNERDDSVQPADNREKRSSETGTSGSLADFRNDASTAREDATFYAAIDNERAAAVGNDDLPHVVPDMIDLGTHWFSRPCEARGAGPQERARAYSRAHGHQILAAGDVRDDTATKRYTTFADAEALQKYDEHLAEFAVERNMYEVMYPELPTRLYFDLECSVAERVDAVFAERLARFAELRAAFFSRVLGLSSLDLSFQTSTAHGESKGGFKHSAHEVLEGFYVENQEERLLFKECFEAFLEDPPSDELAESVPFLEYERNGKSEGIWDAGVYTKFRCFRILGSCKKGSGRPLVPADGSSPELRDHLVGVYDGGQKSALKKIDMGPARAYMVARSQPVRQRRSW